jgi:aspartate racemase
VDFGLIAANTPRRSLEYVPNGTELPILSIIEVTAEAALKSGIKTIGLLGTRFTMQEDFYKRGLAESGLGVVIPEEADMIEVNRGLHFFPPN